MSEELKPCPFCGKNELRQLGALKKVQCINESCDHAFKNPMLPIAWQTRPIEDALRTENERLREALKEIIALDDGNSILKYYERYYQVFKIAREALKEVKE